MNWNLSECLPEKANVQNHFTTMIAGFMSAVYQFLCDQVPNLGTPRRRLIKSLSQTQTAPTGVGIDEATVKFTKELISGDLSQKLFM